MKKTILSIFLFLLFFISIKAQQNHFIYLQTEGKQPFYIKLNKKILSSSSTGYLIIPKLTEGNYTLLLGFPKNEWPEQAINIAIQKNDLGYLVKNFNEKGWALVEMNSYQISYNNTIEKPQPQLAVPPNTIVKEIPKPLIKDDPKPIVKAVIIDLGKETPAQESKEEIYTASKITKLFSSKSNVSIESVYQIKNNGSIDTVRILIPLQDNNSKTNPITQTQASIAPPKEEIKSTPIDPPVVTEAVKLEEPKKIAPVPTNPILKGNCKSMASEEEYKKLRKKMVSAETDNEMLNKAFTTFQKQCYSSEQIKTLSFLFLTDDGKYKFLDTAYPFVYDTDNFSKLSQLLTDEYYIKRFNAMLKN